MEKNVQVFERADEQVRESGKEPTTQSGVKEKNAGDVKESTATNNLQMAPHSRNDGKNKAYNNDNTTRHRGRTTAPHPVARCVRCKRERTQARAHTGDGELSGSGHDARIPCERVVHELGGGECCDIAFIRA